METKMSILCMSFVFIVLKTVCLSSVASSMPVEVNISSNNPTDQGLPSDINVTFTTGTNTSTEFRMVRVDYDNLPIYSIETGQDGQKIKKENVSNNEDVAFYQDTKNGAVVQLFRAKEDEGKLDEFIISRGEYQQGNATYSIQPTLRSKREASQNDSQSDQRYKIRQISARPITKSDYLNPPPEHHSFIPTNMEGHLPFGSKFQRRRRQTFSTYYIDVTAFLDSTCYNRFLREAYYDAAAALTKIREYYAFVFTGIDLIYQNFQSTQFQLRVRLTKVVIFKSTTDFPLVYMRSCYVVYPYTCTTTNYVDTSAILNNFTIFLSSSKGRDLVFPYDHAMLFVGADLWNSAVDILGLAYIQTICRTDGMSSSAIEDTGDYSAILTGAHELGHSLSAQHDGINNTCSFSDRYLMASSATKPTSDTKLNPWRFSQCTIDYFISYLTILADSSRGQTCLSNTLAAIGDFPDVSRRLLGQEIPAVKQCELRYGSESYVCQIPGSTDICTGLYCFNPTSLKYCYSQPGLSGTTCGQCQKVCNQGSCITNSLAPDCGFRDDAPNCTMAHCYDEGMRYYCKRTCADVVITTPTPVQTTTIVRTTKAPYKCVDDETFEFNGVTCQTLVPNLCDYSFIREPCCDACRQISTAKPNYYCYDDTTFIRSDTNENCTSISMDSCMYSSIISRCCQTCSKYTDFLCKDHPTFTYYGMKCQTMNPNLCIFASVNYECCQTCLKTNPDFVYEISSDPKCQDDHHFYKYDVNCHSAMLSSTNYCYFPEVNASCCASCAKRSTKITGCEFGNRDRNLCSSISSCQGRSHDCCQTCMLSGVSPGRKHLLVWNLVTLYLVYLLVLIL